MFRVTEATPTRMSDRVALPAKVAAAGDAIEAALRQDLDGALTNDERSYPARSRTE